MTSNPSRLPKRLDTPVIGDAIFELRFQTSAQVVDLLPGTLLTLFGPPTASSRLPAGQLPTALRQADAELGYQPAVRLDWEAHTAFVGDRLIGIACKLPYRGWSFFKDLINRLLDHVIGIGYVEVVERYSLKYIDFLPDDLFPEGMQKLNWKLEINDASILGHNVVLRTDLKGDDGLTVIREFGSPMVMNAPDSGKVGTMVSTDIIQFVENFDTVAQFREGFESRLEFIHDESKKIFFGCIRPEALEVLGPHYD
ncbi:uncharacterized protein (TIGR04255 family) [Pseudacidovorax sp. 1753]|uniref:TIGR04255 family protein n=1 Tax=Pseudacidovorax sp. 1753 TaxID=3156419 RepID=UPI00339B6A27